MCEERPVVKEGERHRPLRLTFKDVLVVIGYKEGILGSFLSRLVHPHNGCHIIERFGL